MTGRNDWGREGEDKDLDLDLAEAFAELRRMEADSAPGFEKVLTRKSSNPGPRERRVRKALPRRLRWASLTAAAALASVLVYSQWFSLNAKLKKAGDTYQEYELLGGWAPPTAPLFPHERWTRLGSVPELTDVNPLDDLRSSLDALKALN